MWRLIPLALVALVLTPGTWVRTPESAFDYRVPVQVEELSVANPALGSFRIERAWHLFSDNSLFGGYSALLQTEQDRLLLASDFQILLTIDLSSAKPVITDLRRLQTYGMEDKRARDLESLTSDPATGTIWAGYEFTNSIHRLDSELNETGVARPPSMRDWENNAGPEAMVRLRDGRFIVLSEQDNGTHGRHPGRVFAGDPLTRPEVMQFAFLPPEGYRPVDMVQLPSGKVLILVRKVVWGLPPGFRTALVVADPENIAPDGDWTGRIVARLDDPALAENYEGLAVAETAAGELRLFMISDDNRSSFQRTLLLELSSDRLLAKSGSNTKKRAENPARFSYFDR